LGFGRFQDDDRVETKCKTRDLREKGFMLGLNLEIGFLAQ